MKRREFCRTFTVISALAACAWLAGPAAATPFTAQLTDVADAADVDNVFDFNASVGFRRVVKSSRITRENVDTTKGVGVFADELTYGQVTQVLDIRGSVGLFHDLELNFFLPYTLTQDSTWDYRKGVGAQNSTVTNDPTLGGPLFDVPLHTYQRGLSTLDLGIGWSPFNDQRDDTKPTWTLRFTYGIPVGAAYLPVRDPDKTVDAMKVTDPANGRDQNSPAPIGDKIHRLKFEMAFSKRWGYFDPYAVISYTQPIADKSGPVNQVPQNTGGFQAGVEIVPWDSPKERQRLSFDLRVGVQYFGPGRTYSDLTGALRQITYIDNYANIAAGAHLLFQPIEYVRLTAGMTFSHDTTHLLTNESPGKAGVDGVVDLNNPAQVNPLYRPEIDGVGRRFRVEDTFIFSWYVALALMI